ncbi:MAG: SPFH domain-containing protein [bacterium]|nr:SPFH domain-containing protein [bacterium]
MSPAEAAAFSYLPYVIGVVVGLVALLFGYKLVLRVFGIIIIPEDSIGIVNKKWVLFGQNKTLPDGAIIALKGEAGYQADTLAPGLHFWLWPWQYEVTKVKFTTIREGFIGVVESRDGKPLSDGHVLARKISCDAFQNARAFLVNGGERGPQITIIPPGTYRINTSLFKTTEHPVLEIPDNMVGVVTTKEGKPLNTGDIAGPEVAGHNMFQDAQAFVDSGGHKGLQVQVMLAGRYYINPLFAGVETKAMIEVEIAHAGVVISFVGEVGEDITGDSFRHGNLVEKGHKGVWVESLDPGKYTLNPYCYRVESVPTANVVLNWAEGKNESHRLDEKLSTITVRSSDGFTFNLDVSQIIHVPRNDAPKVIARFGTMQNLVSQVLEPTIGNYFRNAAQDSDVITFLSKRKERQEDAKRSIEEGLRDYNVVAVDTLIGDITPPPELMKTLTDRKIASEQRETFNTQREAQDARKELQQAQAMADTQPEVVTAERSVSIADFTAQASIKKAEGDAKSKTINAEADATVTEVTGKAQAGRTLAVGEAEAKVIRQKIESMQPGNFAAIEVSRALATSGQKWVPEIVTGGNGRNGSGSLVDVLLASLALNMNNKNGDTKNLTTATVSEDPEAEKK